MRAFVRPCDSGACGFYRLIAPARALADDPNATVLLPEKQLLTDGHSAVWVGRAFSGLSEVDADVVVIQRPTEARVIEIIEILRKRGVAVVVDMDDDLSTVHPMNHAYEHARTVGHYAEKACAMASLVTVTTPALAERYGAHGRVSIIPNYIPEWYLRIPHKDSAVIGWGGSLGTNPDALSELGDSIKNLVERDGARFLSAGPPLGVGRALGLKHNPKSLGDQTLDNWPYALSKFGVGIAPLASTPFNDAKSRLRPLQFAAVGVPWVGSPVQDYLAFHKLGNGLTAASPGEWERHLRALVKDPSLRHELANQGREIARANTIEGNAYRWAEAWQEASDIESRRSRRRRRAAR